MANHKKVAETAKKYATGAVAALSQRRVFPADMRHAATLLEDAARMLRLSAHEEDVVESQRRVLASVEG